MFSFSRSHCRSSLEAALLGSEFRVSAPGAEGVEAQLQTQKADRERCTEDGFPENSVPPRIKRALRHGKDGGADTPSGKGTGGRPGGRDAEGVFEAKKSPSTW